MRGARRNTLTFGLVSAPVALAPAASPPDSPFCLVAPSGERARQAWLDPATDELVPAGELRRGVEVEPGRVVVVPDAPDLPRLDVIDVVEFVRTRDLPGDWTERVCDSHYVEPQRGAERPLDLLCRAMAAERASAVVLFSVGSRDRLGLLRLRDGREGLVLHTLHFAGSMNRPDERVTSVGTGHPARRPQPRELALARELVRARVGDGGSLARLADEQAEERERAVAAAVAERAAPAAGPDEDLLAALEASLAGAERATR
jgi:non-homologous end joining protein Ku